MESMKFRWRLHEKEAFLLISIQKGNERNYHLDK